NRDIVKALYHYIKGNAFDKIEELLKKHEIKYLLEGNIPYLRNCFDKIPHSIIEKMPQMLFMKAKLDSLYGKPQKAIDNLKIAHRIFKKKNSEEDTLKCLVDLGTLYYNSSGDVQEAKQLMEQVVNEINENTSAFIIIMTYLIFFSAVLGEIDEAEKYSRKAKSVILDYPELERKISTILINTSNNYIYYITGDFYHSQKLNEQLLKSVLKLELQICLPLTYYQYSATSFFLGLYEKGCDYAEKGLNACGEIHLQDSQKGWLYNTLAHNCLGLGNIEGAYENALQSFEIFESHSNRWGMANTYDLFHHISMARNQIHEAKQHLNTAFDIIDGYHLPVTQGILEISMANLLIAETNYKEAQEFLKQSRRKVNDAKYYLFKNYILETRCHLSFHNSEMACEWLEKSLEIAQTKSFDTYIIKENEWIIPLLVELYSKGKQIFYIQKIINKTTDKSTRILSRIKGNKNFQIALAASALLDNVPKPAVSVLNIHLLGRFKVLKGNKEVPIKKWKSAKALMIFKYLAAKRRAGFIPRDVLIELLWPDQDIKKTAKRFNVAMSALRKVLEPDIIPKAASSYILRKKDSYRLDPGKNINIDMDNFLDKINDLKNNSDKNNRELIDQCLSAESLYQGTFLEENILDEWCVSDREYLNEKFLHLLFEIIKINENEKNYIKCIQYAEKYLTADPYEESVYRKLMISHAALGNNTNVLRTYKKCKENIEKLDCPIDKRTVVLLKKLIPQKNNWKKLKI
ncbi:BTAD domain-containing putative transcriptional regulator, partial [Desulfobacterales bacterium HSG17]|nr:BTAD domain-containing putative transcriptional regulator [Desulfobacterales bacterium HSG17]